MLYRWLSAQSSVNIFDRRAKRWQKNRAAASPNASTYDYLKDEVAYRLVDRLGDVSRAFPLALDLGSGRGHVAKFADSDSIGLLVQTDMAEEALKNVTCATTTTKIQADEESIPFRTNSFDLVTSCLALHWVNDLPGTFQQILNLLREDGVFIGALFAVDTLFELRCAFQLAEEAMRGGVAARVSPFTDMQDVGSLLSRAGFVMTTIDVDEIVVNYPTMRALMKDLQCMGESNAAWTRSNYISKSVLREAETIYKSMYGIEEDGSSIPATYRVLHMIGWKPGGNQWQAAERGSGTVSLKDVLEK